MENTKKLMTFKTKTVELYVETFKINNQNKYQALYSSGEAITDISENKEEVIEEFLRVINNTSRLLIINNDEI